MLLISLLLFFLSLAVLPASAGSYSFALSGNAARGNGVMSIDGAGLLYFIGALRTKLVLFNIFALFRSPDASDLCSYFAS